MPRSEEAILRRALKRQRTEEEQRQADRKDMEQAKKRTMHNKKESFRKESSDQNADPMKETGAWTCPSCGNHNFASRRWCNSNYCDEPRPYEAGPRPERPNSHYNSGPRSGSRNQGAGEDPLKEDGAWTCSSCGNHNYASRAVCHSKTCHERRPFDPRVDMQDGGLPRDRPGTKRPRHDPETSKKLVWAKQANESTLSKNQELRKQYLETGGVGMDEKDAERAKILLARDERKRQKQIEKKKVTLVMQAECPSDAKAETNNDGSSQNAQGQLENAGDETKTKETNEEIEGNEAKEKTVSSLSRSKRDKNKVLRKRYIKTGGKGMSAEQVERAKVLIARDARKRSKKSKLDELQ